jgi:hypothetical protein
LAVKLGQSLDTLYNLEYLEYSLLLNIVKKDVEEKTEALSQETTAITPKAPIKVNLPPELRLK